jgi:hypothetical protein
VLCNPAVIAGERAMKGNTYQSVPLSTSQGITRCEPDADIDPSLAMRPRFELENGAYEYNVA